jgi:methionine sulfoxide reductase heme-binding subunit
VTSSTALWYFGRATGVVTLTLLTLVVLAGLLVNRQGRLPGLPRFAVTALHRNIALLSVVFLTAHILLAVVDSYVSIGLVDAVVPFFGGYRPLWLGLGAVAFDLLAAIIITSLVRVRLGLRAWRAVHRLAYAMWPVALLHGVYTGDDLRSGALLWMTAVYAAAVVSAAGWRVTTSRAVTPHAVLAHAAAERSAVR